MNGYLPVLYQLHQPSLESPCHHDLIASLFIYTACQLSMFENYKINFFLFFCFVFDDIFLILVPLVHHWQLCPVMFLPLLIGCSMGHTVGKFSHTAPTPANTAPILTLQPQWQVFTMVCHETLQVWHRTLHSPPYSYWIPIRFLYSLWIPCGFHSFLCVPRNPSWVLVHSYLKSSE